MAVIRVCNVIFQVFASDIAKMRLVGYYTLLDRSSSETSILRGDINQKTVI
jgi:hypothetical protein